MRYDEIEKMHRLEDAYWWFVGRRRLVRALIKRFAGPSPAMLDIGCGTGGNLDVVGALGPVVGADLSMDALGFCRGRGLSALARCQAEQLPFADGSFDVVMACDLIEHVPDDRAAIAEALRVLRPEGLLIITVPAYRWLWSEHDLALSHLRRYEIADVRALLQEQGAPIVKLTYAVSFVFPIVALFRLLRRLRLQRVGKPHTMLMSLPGWLNRAFVALQDVETWIVERWGFAFGTSIVAVARRPPHS